MQAPSFDATATRCIRADRRSALRRRRGWIAAALSLACALAMAPRAAPAVQREAGASAGPLASPHRVIARLRAGATARQARGALSRLGVRVAEARDRSRTVVLEIADRKQGTEQVLKALRDSDLVECAEPDFLVHAQAFVPDDPEFARQWGLDGAADADIDAPEAWSLTTGDPSVVVLVVDTGVDYSHADLADNMWINPGEIPGNGIDDDANGYVDDVHGIDAITGSGDPMDDAAHGTHVAGTLGAVTDNGLGVAGVAPDVRIMACKFLDADGSGLTSDAIECFEYARRMREEYGVDVRVTNNSWGGSGRSLLLRHSMEALDALHAVAAGNDGSDNDASPQYPASFDLDQIVSVAASDRSGALARFSNYGAASVDLAAPGVDILSTVPGDEYAYFRGTSMATPHVAGAAALVWALAPDAKPADVAHLLRSAARPLASLRGSSRSGALLDAHRTLDTCAAGSALIDLGIAEGFRAPIGRELRVAVAVRRCSGPVLGAPVEVVAGAGPALEARDDGLGPDRVSGDGTYTASLVPETAGDLAVRATARVDGQILADEAAGRVLRDYAIRPTRFEWIDATRGDFAGFVADDDAFELPLGFDFELYGERFDRVWVSSNGHLSFGAGSTAYENARIPDQSAPNALVAPYWDDLDPSSGGEIHFLHEAARLTVAWIDVPYYASDATASFEVTVEAGGGLLFQYLDVSSGSGAFGASATIGVESPDGAVGVEHSFDAPAVGNRTALRVSSCRDRDGDGACDDRDNCLSEPNADQTDSDADGYGNACDADYDGDGSVGIRDYAVLRSALGSSEVDARFEPDADHDGDGHITRRDVACFRRYFGRAPGPSGLECRGIVPCTQ